MSFGTMDPNHAEVERQERGRARARGRGRGQQRQVISDEIRATVVHVVVHGRTMKEAGQLVQPNLSRFTVASIVRTFRRENRTERQQSIGGRRRLLTAEQETALVNMVIANNAITLREIQTRIIEDQEIFQGTNSISLSTIDRVIQQNHIRTKQLYRVPFERNSDRVKEQRFQYTMFEMDAMADPHEYIFIDEAGFNLTKRRKRGRNIIGHRAIIQVPGQRGGNITMCAAISNRGILHRHAVLRPYNTALLLQFLDQLHNNILQQEGEPGQPEQAQYVVIWDNVSFHRAALVRTWFNDHPRFLFLPEYSPFLNPIEEFFSAWRWRVYDCNPYTQHNLLEEMVNACEDISLESIQGRIRHTRGYFPRCLAREDIMCDVDEILWPDPDLRQDHADVDADADEPVYVLNLEVL
ncbi:hypothetical protein N1851_006859 [Merluccius polli]|uniref:Tc1-like transposase DDE domain-containing protein n=1 Tax=Merluccius polli TaxID=89951 RepID=A0AA47P907_MERPO|nr:hypothetical protein N1851_006859 [Merluccius polli]